MYNNDDKLESKLMQELGNNIKRCIPNRGFVLICFDDFTNNIISLVASGKFEPDMVFNQAKAMVSDMEERKVFRSKQVGNA